MRISRITVYATDLALKKPYYLSGGRLRFDALDSTVVSIETDDGLEGWGEACPWGSTYLPGFARGVRAGLEELGPQLLGLDPCIPDQVNLVMDTALPGHFYSKSAIDIACWDILARSLGRPVCDLLGGRYGDAVPLISSVSTGTPDDMLQTVRDYRDEGYFMHSVKVGADTGLDIERIRHLSDNSPASETLVYDANRAWLPADAVAVMNAVGAADAVYEQPCETYDECLHVRRMTTSAISLDEIMMDANILARAQADGACEYINIKIGRVGGFSRARRMRDFCVATGIRMLIMETGGSVIADTAAAHLAQATPERFRVATWDCASMLTLRNASGAAAKDGVIRAPDEPGLGVTPDMEVLGAPVATYG